jgi:predicted nucleotidyltransferase
VEVIEMKGWPREPARHSLSARGIRSRAIKNPIADPNLYDREWYSKKGEKHPRKFVGSGLEGINSYDLIETITPVINIIRGFNEDNGTHQYPEEYAASLKSISREMDIPIERIEEFWSNYEDFLQIKAIYVTGSRVTGFYNSKSDVDIYIQYEDRPEFHRQLNDIHMDQTTEVEDFFDGLLEAAYLGIDVSGGDDLHVKDYTTGKKVKVDIMHLSIEPPKVPAIKIWEGPI